MRARCDLFLYGVLVCGCASRVFGGDVQPPAVPEKPFVLFPELPAVLWFEDFENGSGLAELGKVEDAPANGQAGAQVGAPAAAPNIPAKTPAAKEPNVPPNVPVGALVAPGDGSGKAYMFGAVSVIGSTRPGAWARLNFGLTKIKIPGVHKLGQIAVHFSVWAEDAGELQVSSGGKPIGRLSIPTAKKWTPLTVHFNDLARTAPNDAVNDVHMLYIARTAVTSQKVCLDDVLVAAGTAKPAEVMPLIQALRKRQKDIEKTTAKDGFVFSPLNVDALRNALAASGRRRSGKSIIVMAPRSGDGRGLVKALNDAAAKGKLTGYTFVPAVAPDNSPVGGLADMRMLARYNMEKVSSQFMLLVVGYNDARAPGRVDESVRVVLERVVAAGCIPIVSLPPLVPALSSTDKTKLESFENAVGKVCATRGVTVIEAASALKDVAAPLKDGELNEAGLAGVAKVSVDAVRHLDTYLLTRR